MRLLFLSDFHGRMPRVRQWAPDLIVAGGDYCEVDEIRRLKFEAIGRGLPATQWASLIGRAQADDLVERALAEGSAVVSALADAGATVLAIPGNSDRVGYFGPHLADRHLPRPDQPAVEDRVINIETRVVARESFAFAGLGGWSGSHDPERQEREVCSLLQQKRGLDLPLILVSHNVPYQSRLDGVANPELPAFAQGQMVGSRRCVAAIEQLAPILCLCGHLHENFGRTQRIGGTLCVCGAGAYRGDAVLIELLEDGTVGKVEFVHSSAGAVRVLAS